MSILSAPGIRFRLLPDFVEVAVNVRREYVIVRRENLIRRDQMGSLRPCYIDLLVHVFSYLKMGLAIHLFPGCAHQVKNKEFYLYWSTLIVLLSKGTESHLLNVGVMSHESVQTLIFH